MSRSAVCVLSATIWLTSGRADDAAVAIRFTLAEPSRASVAVYATDGRMVREVMRAEPLSAGTHEVRWDGLDAVGRPVAPGVYQWRLLSSQGLRAEYICTVGTSFGHHFWVGNHTGPIALTVDDTGTYISAVAEGVPALVKVGNDNRILWQVREMEPFSAIRSIATVDGKCYAISDTGNIYVLNAATGRQIGKPQRAYRAIRKYAFAASSHAAIPRGWTAATPVKYSQERGYGWEDAKDIDAGDPAGPVSGWHAFSKNESKVFRIELPAGRYAIRIVAGHPNRTCTPVDVVIGQPITAGQRLSTEKLAWHQLPALEPKAAHAQEFPRLYGTTRFADVRDSALRIELAADPQVKDSYWSLQSLEVFAAFERVDGGAGELVASSQPLGTVAWLDPKEAIPMAEVAVPGVRDVAWAKAGRALALTADSVVIVDRSTGAVTPPLISGLINPVAIAVTPGSGEIFVAGGSPDHRVRKFAADGKLLDTFGREGGRKTGRYEATDFLGVSSIAADAAGGYSVAEGQVAPRRIARFDHLGRLVREWFGGQGFYCYSDFDPDDSFTLWMSSQPGWIVQARLDLDGKTWRPIACYEWRHELDPRLFPQSAEYRPVKALRTPLTDPKRRELLLWSLGHPGLLMRVDEQAGRIRPLAALGRLPAALTDSKIPINKEDLHPAWTEAVRTLGHDPLALRTRTRFAAYAWADANGDGDVQASELRFPSIPPSGKTPALLELCTLIDTQLSVYTGSTHAELRGPWVKYPALLRTACGAPVWDLDRAERTQTTPWREAVRLGRDSRGNYYQVYRGGGDGYIAPSTYSPEAHGWAWPANRSDAAALVKYDPTGKPLWQAMPKAARIPHPRGQINQPVSLNGFVHGCVAVGDQVEQPCEFWTEDGLYAGGLFDRKADDGLPGAVYTWMGVKKRIGANTFPEMSLFSGDDMLVGGSLTQLPDETVLFAGAGSQGRPVYKITGWDRFRRQHGEVRVSIPPKPAAGAGTGLRAEYFPSGDLTGPPQGERFAAEVWFGDDKHPWPVHNAKSASWSGFLEPRFTEDYTFGIYATGSVRLWIDGTAIELEAADMPRGGKEIGKWFSVPVPLRSGHRHPIRLEWRGTGGTSPPPKVHLCWESLSQPIRHIPTEYLYPDTANK